MSTTAHMECAPHLIRAGRELAEDDWLCLDGNAGRVLVGQPELVVRRPTEWLQRVEGWKEQPSSVIPAPLTGAC
jgi:hypothetical protein